VLGALNMDRCIRGYSEVWPVNIVPSKSFTWHEHLFGRWAYGVEIYQFSGGDVSISGAHELLTGPRVLIPACVFTERCLMVTNSLSLITAMLSGRIAHRTHPLGYECKQSCWSLCQNKIEVKLMWIPSHVGLVGNELVDERA
jgi:hypothetical protein